jgi:hypothetical protein
MERKRLEIAHSTRTIMNAKVNNSANNPTDIPQNHFQKYPNQPVYVFVCSRRENSAEVRK